MLQRLEMLFSLATPLFLSPHICDTVTLSTKADSLIKEKRKLLAKEMWSYGSVSEQFAGRCVSCMLSVHSGFCHCSCWQVLQKASVDGKGQGRIQEFIQNHQFQNFTARKKPGNHTGKRRDKKISQDLRFRCLKSCQSGSAGDGWV